MAIPCPRCGREYDVTLFQFGRTIHCTCGARVGMEIRLGPPVSSSKAGTSPWNGRFPRSLVLEEAASRVPPAVAERETAFAYCPTCDQVYWKGSHPGRMRVRLDEILG